MRLGCRGGDADADGFRGRCHQRQQQSHFAVYLGLSCKTKRSSLSQQSDHRAQRRASRQPKKKPSEQKADNKQKVYNRSAPRSADRWTMTRRSTKPAERLPCFPFSLMSGSVLPATLRSFTAAPPPAFNTAALRSHTSVKLRKR